MIGSSWVERLPFYRVPSVPMRCHFQKEGTTDPVWTPDVWRGKVLAFSFVRELALRYSWDV